MVRDFLAKRARIGTPSRRVFAIKSVSRMNRNQREFAQIVQPCDRRNVGFAFLVVPDFEDAADKSKDLRIISNPLPLVHDRW